MAVSEMERITIVAPQDLTDPILQVIQATQAIEILDAPQLLQTAAPQAAEETTATTLYLLKRLQKMITFLRQDVQEKDQGQLKRRVLSFQQLTANFNQQEVEAALTQVETIQQNLKNLAQQQQELDQEEQELARWQYLDVHPQTALENAVVKLGIINNRNQENFLQGLKEWPNIYVEEVYQSPNHVYYFVIVPRENQAAFSSLAEKVSFQEVDYTYSVAPKEMYQAVKEQQAVLQKEQQAVKKQLVPYSQQLQRWLLAEEYLLTSLERDKAQEKLATIGRLFILEGFLPVSQKKEFIAQLYEEVPPTSIVVETQAVEQGGDVPTQLANHPLVEPFELLTEMYSLPRYGEIDPTPYMVPFYCIFFGMMVADIGYGLVMFLVTFIALKVLTLKRSQARFLKFFFLLSFPTMLWGLIYGSFFGATLPQEAFGISLPFPILSTTTDVNQILILSVVFGFLQILFGLGINGVLHVKKKEYLESLAGGFCWQGVLLGIALILLGQLVLGQPSLLWLGLVLAIGGALGILIIPIIQTSSKLKGLAKGIYGLYGITGYVGDLVSYTRLMALGIAGGSIGAAFNMLVGYLPLIPRLTLGVILIVLLQTLNLLLSLLSAFVHGARLQYVEFFGKFFSGGGRSFQPLSPSEKHVNVSNQQAVVQKEQTINENNLEKSVVEK